MTTPRTTQKERARVVAAAVAAAVIARLRAKSASTVTATWTRTLMMTSTNCWKRILELSYSERSFFTLVASESMQFNCQCNSCGCFLLVQFNSDFVSMCIYVHAACVQPFINMLNTERAIGNNCC